MSQRKREVAWLQLPLSLEHLSEVLGALQVAYPGARILNTEKEDSISIGYLEEHENEQDNAVYGQEEGGNY
ncbi:MAG: hypothetical protein AAFY91_14770 [Bacteroidota bacterium]